MNEELRENIATLWEQGLTSTEIAKKLKITRGSVMGVIHRFRANGKNISRRINATIIIEPPKEEVEPVAKNPNAPPKIKAKPLPEEAPAPPMTGSNCTFMDLTYRSCRFIIGPVRGLDTIYCGEPKAARSFCKEHQTQCYVYAKPFTAKSADSFGNPQRKSFSPYSD